MTSHIELGKKGELLAKQYLEIKGYSILKINWRFRHKEVDIICKDGTTLVIIEVKTRSDDFFQKPYEAVETRKQLFLIEAAEAFVEEYNDFAELRFDIISIVQHKNTKPQIEHIIEAFLPGINQS